MDGLRDHRQGGEKDYKEKDDKEPNNKEENDQMKSQNSHTYSLMFLRARMKMTMTMRSPKSRMMMWTDIRRLIRDGGNLKPCIFSVRVDTGKGTTALIGL